jgi:putative Holliday junction resolvase
MVFFSRASPDERARVQGSVRNVAPSRARESTLTRLPDTSQRRAILAIDYGRRRIGLAVSDALGLIARPLATWIRVNRRRDLARLRELCRAQGVGVIIVGWPLHLDGKESEMAGEAARFAERIRKHVGLPVELVDERLSSWEAEQAIAEAASPRRSQYGKRRRKPVDDVAAAVILRDYLSRGAGVASRAGHQPAHLAPPEQNPGRS